jgi:hypothetical protein
MNAKKERKERDGVIDFAFLRAFFAVKLIWMALEETLVASKHNG